MIFIMLFIYLFTIHHLVIFLNAENMMGNVKINMPGFIPTTSDEYVCLSKHLNYPHAIYVNQFKASANMSIAHHVLLYGCKETLVSHTTPSQCGMMCSTGESTILYAWGKQAPGLQLPTDTSVKMAGNSEINYLILQVHYLKPLDHKDDTGVTLYWNSQPTGNLASIFLLSSGDGPIPPKKTHFSLDFSCQFHGKTTIYPFAFRTHAHTLGRMNIAYLISSNKKKITEIGKASPQWPQAFYPMKGKMAIQPGDYLAGRCVYDSMERTEATYIGSTHMDEMCNFYLMFSIRENQKSGEFFGCGSNEYPDLIDKLPKESLDYLPDQMPPNYFTSQQQEQQQQQPSLKEGKTGKGFEMDNNWKVNSVLGQISGLSFTKDNQLLIFHRGDRQWDQNTFDFNKIIVDKTPIKENTIFHVNPSNGEVISQWGNNLFLLSHGIYSDHYTGDVWVTDVGAHTVMRFTANQWDKPSLVLGISGVPGDDKEHFCQPADVVTNANGEIFVADGYCNSRIVKFSAKGNYIKEWKSSEGTFAIVHSITIINEYQWVCVADRERASIECFDFNGNPKQRISHELLKDSVFAIEWDQQQRRLLGVSVTTNSLGQTTHGHGFTVKFHSEQKFDISLWNISPHLISFPHDLTVSLDGGLVFVSELHKTKVLKFSSPN